MSDPTPDPLSSSERKWLAEIAAVTAERDEARTRLAVAEAALSQIAGLEIDDPYDYTGPKAIRIATAYLAGDPDA